MATRSVEAARATEVAVRRWWAPAFRTEQVLFVVCLVLVGVLVVPPVLMLLRTSVMVGERLGRAGELSLSAYATIVGSPVLGDLVASTLVFAVGSTVVGLVLGGLLAWITERTDTPFKEWVYAAMFVTFAVPGILRTIGWIFLLGPRTGSLNEAYRSVFRTDGLLLDVYSMPAMVLVEGLFWVPISFLMLAAAFRSMDPSLEEAALVSGANVLKTLYRVTARLALPAILSVLMLSFIRSIQAFEVPLLLGVPAKIHVLTTEVFLSIHTGLVPDYAQACAYGVVLFAFLAVCIRLYGRTVRNASQFATVTGKGFRTRVGRLGRGRILTGGFVLLVVVLQFLPIAAVIVASLLPTFGIDRPFLEQLTLANYVTVLGNTAILESALNSLVIGVVSATLVVVVSALVAWVMVRAQVRGVGWLDPLASLPLVIPGVVMGVALLSLYLRSPVPVYGTIWLLIIAYVTSFLPYGLRYAHPGLLAIHRELEESGRTSGANWLTVFIRIVLPLLLPALFAGWIFVFLISLRELSVAALLYTARSQVIATTMLDLWENGNVNQVSAFGSIVAVVSIAFAMVAYRVSRRWGIQG